MERKGFRRYIHFLSMLMISVFLLSFTISPSIVYAGSTTGVVTASSLNMRKKASTESQVVKVLREGDKVTITDTSGSWYKVKVGGSVGYVSKNYIKKGSSSSSSSSSGSSSKSSSKSSSSGSSGGTLRKGSNGAAVKNLQSKLKKLGYYSGSVDGDFGNGTEEAVKRFQKAKGLGADGVAGAKTLSALGLGGGSSGGYTTERLNWFKNGSKTIPKGAVFEIKDCKTGKTFTVRRWSGANHIDAEPKTASDTKVLKSLYGGSWSWRRRPVLVKYNGHVYAASINGMPHGTQTISNNNFDGHFCIHFYKSKTHGTKKVDEEHQNCVAKAMNYSW